LTAYIARIGEIRYAYKILVGKPEGKRTLGRPRRIREDNIRTDIGEIRWGGMVGMYLAQDRHQWLAVVNKVINLQIP
jgi:hypothetical protein